MTTSRIAGFYNLPLGQRLEKLAEVANVNAKHLCRLFRKTLGCSPMQTHRLLCLQLSLSLLSRSNLPIKQIATMAGFAHVHYMTTIFRQHTGWTPAEYRKHVRL